MSPGLVPQPRPVLQQFLTPSPCLLLGRAAVPHFSDPHLSPHRVSTLRSGRSSPSRRSPRGSRSGQAHVLSSPVLGVSLGATPRTPGTPLCRNGGRAWTRGSTPGRPQGPLGLVLAAPGPSQVASAPRLATGVLAKKADWPPGQQAQTQSRDRSRACSDWPRRDWPGPVIGSPTRRGAEEGPPLGTCWAPRDPCAFGVFTATFQPSTLSQPPCPSVQRGYSCSIKSPAPRSPWGTGGPGQGWWEELCPTQGQGKGDLFPRRTLAGHLSCSPFFLESVGPPGAPRVSAGLGTV